MSIPTQTQPRTGRWQWVCAALGLAVPLLLHVDYIIRDARLPRDLGLFYQRMPRIWSALTGNAALGRVESTDTLVHDLIGTPGAAYEALLAGWLALVGRSPQAFEIVDLLWLAALLGAVFAAGRASSLALGAGQASAQAERSQSTTAATAALLIAGGMPVIIIFARLSWIHIPEAALVIGATVPWLRDPGLKRGTALTAVLGALAMMLRSSALGWLLPLGLVVALGRGGKRPSWRKLTAIGATWLVAAVPVLISLDSYLMPKLQARQRYSVDVPAILPQLLHHAGPLSPAIVVLGLVLAWRQRRNSVVLLLTLWTLMPPLLWAGFRAGMDNFVTGFAAAAVLGAAGLSTLRRPRLVVGLAALPWLFLHLPRALPSPSPASPLDQVFNGLDMATTPSLMSQYRPYSDWGRPDLRALFAASCPPQGRCLVAVDQGLLAPYSEAAGQLGIFLAREDQVDLIDLRSPGPVRAVPRVHALLHYACGSRDESWRQRFPMTSDRLALLASRQHLAVAWSRVVSSDCTVMWSTPRGSVLTPAALPLQQGELVSWPKIGAAGQIQRQPQRQPQKQAGPSRSQWVKPGRSQRHGQGGRGQPQAPSTEP